MKHLCRRITHYVDYCRKPEQSRLELLAQHFGVPAFLLLMTLCILVGVIIALLDEARKVQP